MTAADYYRASDSAERFLDGEVDAELAARGVEAFVHQPR
jgi:hypothetical protein